MPLFLCHQGSTREVKEEAGTDSDPVHLPFATLTERDSGRNRTRK